MGQSRGTTRSRNSRSRIVTSNERRYQIKAFCEGATEENYLNYWRKECRDKTIVTIANTPPTSSLAIVEHAVRQRDIDISESSDETGDAYDAYWCVFDVDDNHKNGALETAIALAKKNDINIALSSPCLEVWFLFHFKDHRRHEEGKVVEGLAYGELCCRKPNLPPTALEALANGYERARAHAQKVADTHRKNGAAEPWNPSSNIWELIDKIKTGGR